jgi:hypothetical protein
MTFPLLVWVPYWRCLFVAHAHSDWKIIASVQWWSESLCGNTAALPGRINTHVLCLSLPNKAHARKRRIWGNNRVVNMHAPWPGLQGTRNTVLWYSLHAPHSACTSRLKGKYYSIFIRVTHCHVYIGMAAIRLGQLNYLYSELSVLT